MSVRVRFAPSPTGQVHIGNIRSAIFNWLFARHQGGAFLLRVEDTDRERSTPAAIETLLEVMAWLGLDYDEPPLYQSSQCALHLAAAERLLAQGDAYRADKGGQGSAILFRLPWRAERLPGVGVVGPVAVEAHPETAVRIAASGVDFAMPSKKGKAMPAGGCLAGFRDLRVFDAAGSCLFSLADQVDEILAGERTVELAGAARLEFTRRQVSFVDLVKGELAKPLDSMKDFVIVRSDGSPVFHLANVCDDITQGITHIVRGDDHVENTYRHLFLFAALGQAPPAYAHLPMIVNQQGKPYSKRDGDAFVGDFRAQGYLPEALFNYLTLLGWNPGDEREKMSRAELVAAFTLERVQQSAAQMDSRKLDNLNGQYMAELPADRFAAEARAVAAAQPWGARIDDDYFAVVASLLQSRTKKYADVAAWGTFFVDLPSYDDDGCRKFLGKEGMAAALAELEERLAGASFEVETIENLVQATAAAQGIPAGKLNQPLRLAVTGCATGAGVFETIAVLGRPRTLARLRQARQTYCE